MKANNYRKEDLFDAEDTDDGNKVVPFDPNAIIQQVLNSKNKNREKNLHHQTPMMKVINHQITVFTWINLMKQINIGLKLSDETNTKRKRMTFCDHIDKNETKNIEWN